MRSLIPLLILLVCPLMMFFMMRGMHGGGHSDTDRADDGPHEREPRSSADVARDERIAELEREVAALRDQAHGRDEGRAGRR